MGLAEGVIIAGVFAVAFLAVCVVVYHLLVQNGRTLLRLEALERQLRDHGILLPEAQPASGGLPAGTVLNDFSLPSLSGETVTLSQWRGRRVLLVFFHPECHFCGQFLAELASLQKFGELAVLPLFISTGDAEKNRRLFDQFEIRFPVLLQEDAELASLLKIPGTPVGYVVNEDGVTATEMLVGEGPLLAALRRPRAPVSAGPGELRGKGKFTRSLAESRIVRDGLRAGTPAPDFTLPALDGGKIALKDYRGQKVLLVFSDPECQPCNRLAPQLEQIHRHSQALRVLMVSRGDRAANQAKAAEHGLTFPIALQRHWEISRAYGMFATPIAYFIDEEGIVASDVAAGLEPIVQLAAAAKGAHV